MCIRDRVNTYLLWEENHVLIVDPGSKSHKLQETIDSQNGVVDAIVLTHGHFDHIAGVDALVKKYHCPVYINELDMAMLQDPKMCIRDSIGVMHQHSQNINRGIRMLLCCFLCDKNGIDNSLAISTRYDLYNFHVLHLRYHYTGKARHMHRILPQIMP